jgi:hypothetical protein
LQCRNGKNSPTHRQLSPLLNPTYNEMKYRFSTPSFLLCPSLLQRGGPHDRRKGKSVFGSRYSSSFPWLDVSNSRARCAEMADPGDGGRRALPVAALSEPGIVAWALRSFPALGMQLISVPSLVDREWIVSQAQRCIEDRATQDLSGR